MDDRRLLDEYVGSGSESAFEELVRRHIDLVYATCRRTVKDAHLAEDAAQAVFIVLARKAGSISRRTPLVAWLHETARYVSANAVRLAAIRRKHEMRAAEDALRRDQERMTPPRALAGAAGTAELDEALSRLGAEDRAAVLLHYVEGRTHREVGEALHLSEEAARKRVSRAMERLRLLLTPTGGSALGVAAAAQILAA